MPLLSEYKINVLDAYEALMASLGHFKEALAQDESLVSWMQDLPDLIALKRPARSLRDKAYTLISQVEYLDQQEPREILVCAGFIGASPDTLKAVNALNHCKDHFKSAMLELKKAKISLKDDSLNKAFENLLSSRDLTTALTLNRMGLSRLHLKQCYRKVPILDYAPKKISWTWAHTRSIKRISVAEATSMLMKKNQDHGIQQQLIKISSLSPKEPLAIVQELAPHLRANILLNETAGTKNRIMVKGPVPIFFPANASTPAPQFKPPPEKQQKNSNRLIRKDVRLDPQPFLPAIRVHRYAEYE